MRRYLDSDFYYTEDQALAALAFSLAQEQTGAKQVLNALEKVQNVNGSFYITYNQTGSSIYPGAGDRRVNGANALVAMALVF